MKRLTRREFLVISGGLAAGGLARTAVRAQRLAARSSTSVVIYRLSLRGRRGSNAAKKHNANMRFATESAADHHRAHRGDRSRIVRLTISADEFHRLFPSPSILVADLRKVRVACVGDCNGDGQVTINELLTMVNGALGAAPVAACAAGDASADGEITVDEILTGVNNALKGCQGN
jgi:hypothetical protein